MSETVQKIIDATVILIVVIYVASRPFAFGTVINALSSSYTSVLSAFFAPLKPGNA